ncbi:MAG: hypothetical protein ABI950_12510 [Solirubrobacteraceae bacterium]
MSRPSTPLIRSVTALLAVVALLALGAATASADRAFAPRFGITARGSIATAGNTLLTCPASAACTTAQGGGANGNNDTYAMGYVDVDSDA